MNTSITKGVQRKIILSWIFAQIARLNPNKAGLFEGSFFRGGQFLTAPSPFHPISTELIQNQYTFIEFLNRLFKVGSRLKKCWDHLLYTHAISLFATRNLSLENAVLEKRQREGQIDSLLRVNWRPVLIDIN